MARLVTKNQRAALNAAPTLSASNAVATATEIAALDRRVDTLESGSALASDLTALDGRVDTLETAMALAALAADLTALAERVTTLEGAGG